MGASPDNLGSQVPAREALREGVVMANPADSRIAIRNRDTGELAHGIRGHIPLGWEEVKNAAEEHEQAGLRSVESPRLATRKPGDGHDSVPKRPVQAVPGRSRPDAGGKPDFGDAA
jgi:hypothetical protein